MTTIDFNALMSEAGEGFQPIPDGAYHIEVAKAEAVTTSTNKPMLKLQLRIIGGPHAGRLVFDQIVLTAGNANALSFFFEHMAALGLDRSFFSQNPPMATVASTLLNRQALITIGTRTDGQYAGRNEVKKYSPPPMGQVGGSPTMMPSAPAAPPVAPPAPVAAPPAAPVMPVAPPQAPQPAPAAPVAPPMPVAPPAPIPPLPPGVVAPQPIHQPPQPAAYVPPAPVQAGVPVYNPADEEPY